MTCVCRSQERMTWLRFHALLPQMVCQATTAQDQRIRVGAFTCLHEIAANYYSKLPAYMTEIFNVSIKAISGDTEDVALQVT